MQFLHPLLAWGFLLVLVPLAIHLINMMRHRRIKWAAMDFLLQSYKKHRKWVWLKQLLLLLTRMAVVALLVAMLAQWITSGQWLDLVGSRTTHHYVLLDDSMSMSDRAGDRSAFDDALRFIQRLGAEAVQQDLPQKFTLVRFSRAAQAADLPDDQAGQIAELNAELVDSEFGLLLEERRNRLEVTELPVGPRPALELMQRLCEQTSDEDRHVYLVSDFRRSDWESPAELRGLLAELEESGAQLHLVNCVQGERPNLAIVDVQPTTATRAAGVPLFVNVTVRNYGKEPVTKVRIGVRTRFHDDEALASGDWDKPASTNDELPLTQIERIDAGATATQRVQVFFPKPGKHVVEARLPEDAVSGDNRGWCVVEFPEGEPTLVIDGDPDGRNAFFMQTIFQPGQRVRTGIVPDFQQPAFLNEATADLLARYTCVYLLDVGRLDERAVANLEEYLRNGGGLGIFLGPQADVAFFNQQLHRDGAGPFPLPLDRADLLPEPFEEGTPDIVVDEETHPIFAGLLSGRNPIIRTVSVERYVRAKELWRPDPDSGVRIVARLRNQQPLVVERSFGEGRVIAFTSTYGPFWNDLVLGPSVVVPLQLHSYLGAARRSTRRQVVGQQLESRFASEDFRKDVRIFTPSPDPANPLVIERAAARPQPDVPVYAVALKPTETQRSGVYEFWTSRSEGGRTAERFAVNVVEREGDLQKVASRELLERLDPVEVDWREADEFASADIQQAGFNRSLLLMGLLLVFLLAEQLLAYWNSYHPARGAAR